MFLTRFSTGVTRNLFKQLCWFENMNSKFIHLILTSYALFSYFSLWSFDTHFINICIIHWIGFQCNVVVSLDLAFDLKQMNNTFSFRKNRVSKKMIDKKQTKKKQKTNKQKKKKQITQTRKLWKMKTSFNLKSFQCGLFP